MNLTGFPPKLHNLLKQSNKLLFSRGGYLTFTAKQLSHSHRFLSFNVSSLSHVYETLTVVLERVVKLQINQVHIKPGRNNVKQGTDKRLTFNVVRRKIPV